MLIKQEIVEALGTVFPAWCTSMHQVVLHIKTELTPQSVEMAFCIGIKSSGQTKYRKCK
jgi:hypothetical protein